MGQDIQGVLIQPYCPGPGCLQIYPAMADHDGLKSVSTVSEPTLASLSQPFLGSGQPGQFVVCNFSQHFLLHQDHNL